MIHTCDLVLADRKPLATDAARWSLSTDWARAGDELAAAFARLATIHNLFSANDPPLQTSLKALHEGARLTDKLIIHSCQDAGTEAFATFDKRFVSRHKPSATTP